MLALIAAALVAGSAFAGAESKAEEEFKGLDAAAKRKIRVAVFKMKAEGVPAQKRDPIGAVAEQFKLDRDTVKMVVDEKVETPKSKSMPKSGDQRIDRSVKGRNDAPVAVEVFDYPEEKKQLYMVKNQDFIEDVVFAACFYAEVNKGGPILLVVMRNGKNNLWTGQDRTMTLNWDDKVCSIEPIKTKFDIMENGRIVEGVGFMVPNDVWVEIVNAETIKFRVAKFKFTATDRLKKQLRALDERYREFERQKEK